MSRVCPDCKTGELRILGLSDDKQHIVVDCDECEYVAELGPNGLNEGGHEYVEAWEMEQEEQQRREQREKGSANG